MWVSDICLSWLFILQPGHCAWSFQTNAAACSCLRLSGVGVGVGVGVDVDVDVGVDVGVGVHVVCVCLVHEAQPVLVQTRHLEQ